MYCTNNQKGSQFNMKKTVMNSSETFKSFKPFYFYIVIDLNRYLWVINLTRVKIAWVNLIYCCTQLFSDDVL